MAMKTNVRPLSDRVVIERFAADEKTAGGLYLPENAKNKPRRARFWRSARASC